MLKQRILGTMNEPDLHLRWSKLFGRALDETLTCEEVAELAELSAAMAKRHDAVSLQCRLELVERRTAREGMH